jgi:hypothetical protein
MPIAIILSFFGGKVLSVLWDLSSWKKLGRTCVCLTIAYAAIFPMHMDWLLINESRYAAEDWMKTHLREGSLVETFADPVLYKYYPRFPSWVRLRSSKIESGSRWEPITADSDKVRLPNIYRGREDPDFIVLSDFWYGRFLEEQPRATQEASFLADLFEGKTDFSLVAEFKTATFTSHGLHINPRIVIFERQRFDSRSAPKNQFATLRPVGPAGGGSAVPPYSNAPLSLAAPTTTLPSKSFGA